MSGAQLFKTLFCVGSSSPRWVLQELRSHEENWSGYCGRYNCLDRTSFPYWTWYWAWQKIKSVVYLAWGSKAQVYKISLNLEVVSPWDTVEICSNALKPGPWQFPDRGSSDITTPTLLSMTLAHQSQGPWPHSQGKEVNPGWPEMVSLLPKLCLHYLVQGWKGLRVNGKAMGKKRKTLLPNSKTRTLQT